MRAGRKREPARPSIVAWVASLGGIGLVLGYFAPLLLAPEANTGPLIGILVTGPVAAIGGATLGVLLTFAPVSNAARRRAWAAACVVTAGATLYRCLPEPAVRGYVIDARVEACTAPAAAFAAALGEWEQAVARVTWAQPATDWREAARGAVERDRGTVLRVRVLRRSAVLRHRRPWDRGRLSAGQWTAANDVERYYAGDARRLCPPEGQRSLFWPAVDPDFDPTTPSEPWPPADTLGFLGLRTLEPVPPEYARLLR